MARTTIALNYLGSDNDFCLRLTLGYKQFVEHVFSPGESLDVTDLGTADEFNRIPLLAELIADGTFSVTVTPGDNDITNYDQVFASDDNPLDIQLDASIDPGVASTFSRSDHVHGLDDDAVVAAKIAANAVTGAKLAQLTSGVGIPQLIYKAITAGAGGSADDVTIIASTPYKLRVIDAFLVVTTTGGTTLDVRTATAGGGTKLVGTMATDSAGIARPAGTTPTSTATVNAASALYARRGDSAMAGELFLWVMAEA